MEMNQVYIDKQLINISKKIKDLRIQKGYTSYENFALDNNIDRKQYWRVEDGTNITLKTLIKILEIHKISLRDFFNDPLFE